MTNPSENELVSKAREQEREKCARLLEMKSPDILLMAGEMTAQELLTVKAVLAGLARRIRNQHF